jgi:ACR3 family arsenite transporter
LGVIGRPEEAGPFDVVMAIEVIEHVPEAEMPVFLSQLKQALKPGGTLILSTPNGEALEQSAIYGPESGAALATVVGVLVEVPVMLSVCTICNRTRGWFAAGSTQECPDPQPGCCANWFEFSKSG